LRARREWPALQDTLQRHAQLLPGESPAYVMQLIRGGKSSGESETLEIYFNMCDLPKSFTPPVNKRRLFTSEAARYQGTSAARESIEGNLAPYECMVFGPPGYQPLAT